MAYIHNNFNHPYSAFHVLRMRSAEDATVQFGLQRYMQCKHRAPLESTVQQYLLMYTCNIRVSTVCLTYYTTIDVHTLRGNNSNICYMFL